MDKPLEKEHAEIRPKVLATALRFFRTSRLDGDPEDVVQDVLLRLWMTRRDGIRIRSAEAWAVSTTKNSCISLRREEELRQDECRPQCEGASRSVEYAVLK